MCIRDSVTLVDSANRWNAGSFECSWPSYVLNRIRWEWIRRRFIDTVNARAADCAVYGWTDAGPDYGLLRYLGLFRPPQRSLTWDRVAKLLAELQQMIAAGQIERHGRFWAAPHAVWQTALDSLFERQGLMLPLKTHGYLLEIIVGMANKTEASAETAEEQRRHQPRDRDPSGGMNAISALLATMPQGEPPRRSAPPLLIQGGEKGCEKSKLNRSRIGWRGCWANNNFGRFRPFSVSACCWRLPRACSR